MGDQTHIIELIDQILEETSSQPQLQEKIFDLRDALFHSQQMTQQLSLKIKTLEETVDKLKSPAHRIGTILGEGQEGLYRLVVGGTEYQAAVSPELLENEGLKTGDQVALNEGFVAIQKLPLPEQGPMVKITGKLANGQWLVSGATAGSETIAFHHADLDADDLKEGEEVYLDSNQKVILGKLAKRESKAFSDDDYIQVDWNQVGGQEKMIEEVRKVIEYPILHKEILSRMEYQMPKGFLFYGPPGCGKTLMGRAILTEVIRKLSGKEEKELQGRFIHVKGPEILNMWLGESERKIREIFQKARDYREEGQVPFIFIDEAESVLGTRQASRGLNISNTLVPMFCAEMDGIQSLRDTVVILATNRPDLIDPAILRPGRIDRKIKVGRPDRKDCQAILKVYLKKTFPMEHSNFEKMAEPFLDKLFLRTPEQEVLVLTLRSGDFKKLYWKDFISGAVIESVVKRAKERAIERAINGEELIITVEDLLASLENRVHRKQSAACGIEFRGLVAVVGYGIAQCSTGEEAQPIGPRGGNHHQTVDLMSETVPLMGIETEYGIIHEDVESSDPVEESMHLLQRCEIPSSFRTWSYRCENSHLDLRGFNVPSLAQDEEEDEFCAEDRKRPYSYWEMKCDRVLTNGARFYNDHTHPEYTTPECNSVFQLVTHDLAGERIVAECARLRNQDLGENVVQLFKNNTDYSGHSYGTHDNFLIPRNLPFEDWVGGLVPFLVTRQLFAGAGKVGSENRKGPDFSGLQLSQRSDFIESLLSIETMTLRPIINTRDEPHASSEQYRRLHLILGDANMSAYATALRVGTTRLVLTLIGEQKLKKQPRLADPVDDVKRVSLDKTGKVLLKEISGQTITPLEVQNFYLDVAEKFYAGRCKETDWVIHEWRRTLDQLENSPEKLSDRIDWAIKEKLFSAFIEEENLNWEDPWLKSLDLEYHNLDPKRGLYRGLEQEGNVLRLFPEEEVTQAVTQPPEGTRAMIRGLVVQNELENIKNIHWTGVDFKTGDALDLSQVISPADVEKTLNSKKEQFAWI